MNQSMKQRMLTGELYIADDAELRAEHACAQELLERYNATRHADGAIRGLALSP